MPEAEDSIGSYILMLEAVALTKVRRLMRAFQDGVPRFLQPLKEVSWIMTDLQFIQRLRLDLSDPQRWPEIRGVVCSEADAALAANELLVGPVVGPAVDPVVFRVTVESLAPRSDAGLSP